MNLTNYILAFAELLEKGALITKEDPAQNTGLKAEDHPMHVILANVLRKAVNSNVMASVADDFHAAFNAVSNEKNLLAAKVQELLGNSTIMIKDRVPDNGDPTAPVEGEVAPMESGEVK